VWAVEKFSKVGTEARPMGTEELKSFIAADVKILTALLKKHGNQMFDAQSISTDAPLLDKAHTRSSSRNAVSG
jgi:hypothetical protein